MKEPTEEQLAKAESLAIVGSRELIAQALADEHARAEDSGLEMAAVLCDVRAISARVNQDRHPRGADAYYRAEAEADAWEDAAASIRALKSTP